jgi:hypothetical protein
LASFVAILVMVPASFTFIGVLQESTFNNNAKLFIQKELDGLPNASYMKKYAAYHYNGGKASTIEITSFGADQIDEATMGVLRNRLNAYSSLADTELVLNQSMKDNSFRDEVRYMEELRSRDSLDLMTKTQKIVYLEDKVTRLSRLEAGLIPFDAICKEAKVNYEDIKTLSYGNTFISNFNTVDTIDIFTVTWNESMSNAEKTKGRERLYNWLKVRLNKDTLVVK